MWTEKRHWFEFQVSTVIGASLLFAWSTLVNGAFEWRRFDGLAIRDAVQHILAAQDRALQETLHGRNERRARPNRDLLDAQVLVVDPLQDINRHWTTYPLWQPILSWSILTFVLVSLGVQTLRLLIGK